VTNPSPVRVRRSAPAKFVATNARGAQITIGRSQDGADFSPVELLMAALGACAGLSADDVVSRRLGADAPIEVVVEAEKDDEGDRLTSASTRFVLDASSLSAADAETLATVVRRAVERTCTVSRSVEPTLPVTLTV
jgi:uncharacterized OsmC-like protein